LSRFPLNLSICLPNRGLAIDFACPRNPNEILTNSLCLPYAPSGTILFSGLLKAF
jgi:hypothetical protein